MGKEKLDDRNISEGVALALADELGQEGRHLTEHPSKTSRWSSSADRDLNSH
jgi:hypothetical protein